VFVRCDDVDCDKLGYVHLDVALFVQMSQNMSHASVSILLNGFVTVPFTAVAHSGEFVYSAAGLIKAILEATSSFFVLFLQLFPKSSRVLCAGADFVSDSKVGSEPVRAIRCPARDAVEARHTGSLFVELSPQKRSLAPGPYGEVEEALSRRQAHRLRQVQHVYP